MTPTPRTLAAITRALVARLRLRLCLWAFLSGVVLTGTAGATADGPDYYQPRAIAPGGSVALRAAPRDDAPVVGRIRASATCLRNLGCQGGLSLAEFSTLSKPAQQQRLAENPRWCQVEAASGTGWLPGMHLAESAIACAGPGSGIALSGQGALVLRDQIRGDAFVDYRVQGRAGQTLVAGLQGSHPQNYMNLIPPGGDPAMFVGNLSGSGLERMLPVDGVYVVRVYLMRAAARRQAGSRYTLSLRLSGAPLIPRDSAQDARIAGTPFHAQAGVRCGPQMADLASRGECTASVIRYQHDASATVVLRWTQGSLPRVRHLLFIAGRVVGSDSVDLPRMEGSGDPYHVYVGAEEHHELPHALVSGG